MIRNNNFRKLMKVNTPLIFLITFEDQLLTILVRHNYHIFRIVNDKSNLKKDWNTTIKTSSEALRNPYLHTRLNSLYGKRSFSNLAPKILNKFSVSSVFQSVNNELADAWKTGLGKDVLRKSITFFHFFEDFF